MGQRMAAALLSSGYELVVHDIDPTARERVAVLGAQVESTGRAVAEHASVVLLSLPLPSDVRAVVEGTDGLLSAAPAPRLVIDLSTIDPETTQQLAETAKHRGVEYLDAPVLGRPATCGQWTLAVGGYERALALAMPILKCLAARVVHVGPHGTGHILKLLNNLMFGAINAITSECMAGAQSLGLAPAVFYSTVVDSGAATVSNLLREIGPKMLDCDWTQTFTVELLEKDNRLAVEMLAHAGLEPLVGKATSELNRKGVAAGLATEDTAALVKVVKGSPWGSSHEKMAVTW